jgi:hypothetical protein
MPQLLCKIPNIHHYTTTTTVTTVSKVTVLQLLCKIPNIHHQTMTTTVTTVSKQFGAFSSFPCPIVSGKILVPTVTIVTFSSPAFPMSQPKVLSQLSQSSQNESSHSHRPLSQCLSQKCCPNRHNHPNMAISPVRVLFQLSQNESSHSHLQASNVSRQSFVTTVTKRNIPFSSSASKSPPQNPYLNCHNRHNPHSFPFPPHRTPVPE